MCKHAPRVFEDPRMEEIMGLVQILECAERLQAELGGAELASLEDLGDHESEHRVILQVLAERLVAIEAMHREVLDKIRIAQAAEMEWRMAIRARDRVVFINAAGELADIPKLLLDVLAAGRAADVRVEKTEAGVVIDDERGERTVVPLPFLINLPRLLKQWERGAFSVPFPPVAKDENTVSTSGEDRHDE